MFRIIPAIVLGLAALCIPAAWTSAAAPSPGRADIADQPTQPTISSGEQEYEEPEEVGPPIMAIIGMIVLVAICVMLGLLLGAAAVAGALLTASAAGLTFVGVTSASLIAGLARRSVGDGVRVWVLLLAGLGGGGVGAGMSALTMWAWALPVEKWAWMGAGAVCGAGVGYFVGRLFNYAWGLVVERLQEWWRQRTTRQTLKPTHAEA